MPFSKLYDSPAAAVADIPDGATILLGGASSHDAPAGLLAALAQSGVRGLACVCDFAARRSADENDDSDAGGGVIAQLAGGGVIAQLAGAGVIARIISPQPFAGTGGDILRNLRAAGRLQIETLPRGALAERLRAAGAGIGGVFVPAAPGTRFAEGRETRVINGVTSVLETPLRADFALLRAARADTLGNLAYRGSQRAWNATMAPAARIAIAEADAIGPPGSIDPELVITPGIYINRIVAAGAGQSPRTANDTDRQP